MFTTEPTPRTVRAQGPSAVSEIVSTIAPVAAIGGLLWYAVSTGLPAGNAFTGAAGVLATQVLPGALCWRAVRPPEGWLLEDLAMGFAIGSTMAIGAQVVGGLTGVGQLAAAIPLAVTALLLLVPITRGRILRARTTRLPWWCGTGLAVASLGAIPQLVSYFSRHQLTWPPGAWLPHIDVYLHQALAAQLLHRGPTSWPTVAGEDLGYHWFAHAWIAQTSAVSRMGLDEVIMRFMPAVMPMVVVLATGMAALRLSGRPGIALTAGALAMLGGNLNVFGQLSPGYPVEPNSPTLALGAPTLLAIVVVLVVTWRREALTGAYLLLPLLSVAAAGTKGSTVPLVVAGLALAAGAMAVFNRPLVKRVLVDLVVVALSLVFTMVVVFHGSSAGLALDVVEAAGQTPFAGWFGMLRSGGAQVLALVVTVVGMLSRGLGVFALPFSRTGRLDPLTWLLIGATVSGVGAGAAFSHPGKSQWYFALTAFPLMAVGSALGLAYLSDVLGRRLVWTVLLAVGAGALLVLAPEWIVGPLVPEDLQRAVSMVAVAAGALVVAGLASAVALRRSTNVVKAAAVAITLTLMAGGVVGFFDSLLQPVRTTWGPVPRKFATATTQLQIDAAEYIRRHSHVDDLVMTNRHCTDLAYPFDVCDSRRWLVTAFSERQALVEGWTATPRATRLAPRGRDSVTVPYWKPDVLELNDQFIARPSHEAAERLRALGVRWVYVDYLRPHAKNPAPFAILRYKNSQAAVWELPPRP